MNPVNGWLDGVVRLLDRSPLARRLVDAVAGRAIGPHAARATCVPSNMTTCRQLDAPFNTCFWPWQTLYVYVGDPLDCNRNDWWNLPHCCS
jgi:hypothetical protein